MSDSKAPANNVIDLTPGNLDAQVRGLLDKGDMEHLRRLLADQHSTDVADVLERLSNPADRNAAFRLLSPQMAAEVIEEISHYTARELVSRTRMIMSDRCCDTWKSTIWSKSSATNCATVPTALRP